MDSPAADEHQAQLARHSNTAPPASGPVKPKKGDMVFYEHVSKDAAKLNLGQEVDPKNYVIKDVKIPKPFNCDNCRAICKPRKCSKCQTVVYCSSECQKASWPTHKVMCRTLAPSTRTFEKAVLKLSSRMMGDHDFTEQLFSIIVVALDLHNHPERSRTHYIFFFWDLVPLRTAKEYQQDLPAKDRANDRGKRYMLELVRVQIERIADYPMQIQNSIASRRKVYIEQNHARLRNQGFEEDSMDDCHHICIHFQYSKTSTEQRRGGALILFGSINPGVVGLKYAAALREIVKLIELSDKVVSENDYIQYAIRLFNSQIITSQTGRNFRTSISLDEADQGED